MQPVAEANVIHVTAENFQSLAAEGTPIIIDFWAPWCGPCRMMKPILSEVAAELAGQVRVGELNVDNEPAISEMFGIMSIPTCLILKGGKVVDSIVGVVPAAQFVARVKRSL